MKITEVVPADVAGFCDIATGECVVIEPKAAEDTASPPAADSLNVHTRR